MKKNIIIIISIIILAVTGLSIWNYLSSFRNVNFLVKEPNLVVEIYTNKDQKIKSITDTTVTLSLQNGLYYYKIDNEKIGSLKQNFNIDKSVSEIIIDPDYSYEYLNNLLLTEKVSIIKLIKETFPKIIDGYDISNERLFSKGEWFGATITRKTQPGDITDPYKIVFNKQDSKWVMIHYPEIVVTKYTFPDVPIDILNSINQLSN